MSEFHTETRKFFALRAFIFVRRTYSKVWEPVNKIFQISLTREININVNFLSVFENLKKKYAKFELDSDRSPVIHDLFSHKIFEGQLKAKYRQMQGDH